MPFPFAGEICALLAPLCWSVAVVLFKRSDAASPMALNLFKNTVAILLLTVTLFAFGIGIPEDRSAWDWARLALSGVLGLSVGDTLIFAALQRVGAGRFALIDTTYAPVIVACSMIFLHEPAGPGFVVGAILVVIGVTVASVEPKSLKVEGDEPFPWAGVLLGFLGIVAMALGVILSKPVLEASSLVEVTWSRMVAGVAGQAVWLTVRGGWRGTLPVFRPSRLWKTMVPAAVIGSYVSMLLWVGGFKWAPASVAAVLNQMSTVYILAMAWLVLKEKLEIRQVVGALLAAVGAAVVGLTRTG